MDVKTAIKPMVISVVRLIILCNISSVLLNFGFLSVMMLFNINIRLFLTKLVTPTEAQFS